MKTIEITIDRDGQSRVETKGFSGHDCRQASRFVEAALGVVLNDRPTSEAFQAQEQSQKINQHG